MKQRNEEDKIMDTVDDPSNYSQTRRLQQIYDARKDVTEKLSEIEAQRRSGRISNYLASSLLRSKLESYLMELEPLYNNYKQKAKYYWDKPTQKERKKIRQKARQQNNGELDTKEVEEIVENHIQKRYNFLGRMRVPTPITDQEIKDIELVSHNQQPPLELEFWGLSSILNTDSPIRATYRLKVKNIRNTEIQTKTKECEIDISILKNAYRIAGSFLSDIGVDLDPEKELDHKLL